jgi:putative tricarboxylic transport membrane protein
MGLFGVYVTVASSRLAYVSEYGPGPGFLPLWLGIGLIGLSLYLIASNLAHPPVSTSGKSESWMAVTRVLGGWLALMFAILFLPWVGFSMSLVVLSIILILTLERRPPWTAVSVALGLGLGFYFIFVFALGVSLPPGPWGF